jgi:flavin reductase (DIM6/NTAB) family NADH-FMN oxidoreductase RutF
MVLDLRGVMRHFATGVCVATTYTDGPDGRHHDAVTINSLTSVSLDPPLVSLCLRLGSTFLADLLATKRWAISILNGGDSDIAKLLAQDRPARAAAMGTLPASPGCHTAALVLDTASWLECVLWGSFDVGDHTLVIGEVVAAGIQQPGPLLIFLHGSYHVLEDTRPITPRPVPDAMMPVQERADDHHVIGTGHSALFRNSSCRPRRGPLTPVRNVRLLEKTRLLLIFDHI